MELMTQDDFDKLIAEFVKSVGLAEYDYGQGGTLETYQGMKKRVIAAFAAALARIATLEAAKDGAYSERDKLVAALSKLYPASLERHKPEDDDWENDWRWVVIIDLPTGQVSWHIHDSELPLFDHLPKNANRFWDGHTTDEKYQRLMKL